jgi:transportin-3
MLLQEMMPLFDALLQKFGSVSRVSEASCRTFKNCIISYDKHMLLLVPVLIPRMTGVYQATGGSCYVWICSHLLRRFGPSASGELQIAFRSMIESINTATFRTLNTAARFGETPDGALRVLSL